MIAQPVLLPTERWVRPSAGDVEQNVPVALLLFPEAVAHDRHRAAVGQLLEKAKRELLAVVLDHGACPIG